MRDERDAKIDKCADCIARLSIAIGEERLAGMQEEMKGKRCR